MVLVSICLSTIHRDSYIPAQHSAVGVNNLLLYAGTVGKAVPSNVSTKVLIILVLVLVNVLKLTDGIVFYDTVSNTT